MEGSAADEEVRLAALADEVSATTVLPWQRAQLEARDRVLDLILAQRQRQRFERIVRDARDIGTVMAQGPPSSDAALAALRASGAYQDANR